MILLLTTKKNVTVNQKLARCGLVETVRVPKAPARRIATERLKPNDRPHWAERDLQQIIDNVDFDEVQAVVCANTKSQPFAQILGERLPDTAVLADQEIAAGILAELHENGAVVSRQTIHDLLDPLRPMRPPTPRFLFDRQARPKTVVSLVQNAVVGDSRVQKVADSLARLGYQSILLGRAPDDVPDGDWFLVGNALIIRLPVRPTTIRSQRDAPPGSPLTRLIGFASESDNVTAERRSRREQDMLPPGEQVPFQSRVRRRMARWRRSIYRENKQSFTGGTKPNRYHQRKASRLLSNRSNTDPESAYPVIGDLEEQIGPALDALLPDAIHVHDPSLLGIATRARNRLRSQGMEVPIIYDAHEWTPGMERPHAYQTAALSALEHQMIDQVDVNITVSNTIADMMVNEFQLPTTPVVIENAPRAGIDSEFRDIRSDAGVPADAPLLVYVGIISEIRGLSDAVAALKYLPTAHLVTVSPQGRPLRKLQRQAATDGVAHRLHQVDYVPADKVPSYLRTADIGLAPHRPSGNHGLALPTKFREYLLAGLPIVATDLGVVGEFIRDAGIGETSQPADPTDFAAALRKVIENPERYRSRITPELTEPHTWQAQEKRLAAIYADAIGAPGEAETLAPQLLIGAKNSAGQSYSWARALRVAGVDAVSVEIGSSDRIFAYPADLTIPAKSLNSLDRRVSGLLNLVLKSQAIILESGAPLAATDPARIHSRRSGFRQARILRDAGHRVGLIFHGSDIRRPDIHIRTHQNSPFTNPAAANLTAALRESTRIVHEELADWDGPVMVSTPDLLGATAGAQWVPVVVNLADFPLPPGTSNEKNDLPPLVVHLPSSSLLKGSHLIDPVLRRLAGEGVIRYASYRNLPHVEVPAILRQADIFVDQLGMGILGVAGIEAMAAGAALVTDPGPEALAAYGDEVPLIAIDEATLEDSIRELVADHDRRSELTTSGRAFAERHHDGRRSAAAIATALGLELPDGKNDQEPGTRPT
jgi:glycosyltransferase involved in cell wall biosynthesis